MTRTGFLAVPLLMLAACSGDSDSEANGEENTAPAPIPLETETLTQSGADPVDDALVNRIPTRFQGAWDYVEGTCSPDSDLRMEISGSEILFYESIGMVTSVDAEGEDVVVSLAMEGEGETWEQGLRLALIGEGEAQLLETSDGTKPRAADDYPSKKCPAS